VQPHLELGQDLGEPEVAGVVAGRAQQRAETQVLLERHRAGEPGIILGLDDLLATLDGAGDGDPPRAAAG
jgi:hypothetical protein